MHCLRRLVPPGQGHTEGLGEAGRGQCACAHEGLTHRCLRAVACVFAQSLVAHVLAQSLAYNQLETVAGLRELWGGEYTLEELDLKVPPPDTHNPSMRLWRSWI